MQIRGLILAGVILGSATLAAAQEAPLGSATKAEPAEQKALDAFKGKVKGKIVWSSSRANSKHDIWIMNADGTEQKPLTTGGHLDWFPRFSPDGQKVIFTRSKMGWVPEMQAEFFDKWDVWTVNVDGTGETKVASDAVWGTWRPSGDSIVFARGPKVFIKKLGEESDKELFDADVVIKKGAVAQQPELSPSGKFLAMTVRGTVRKTAIYNVEKKILNGMGGGCEITFVPGEKKALRMNEGHGNGGTEVLQIELDADGKAIGNVEALAIPKEMKFMDLPGRRSHEYFPHLNKTGEYMVWGASRGDHEHDVSDYDIYIWKLGTNADKDFVRLTFHSGNDRWPDLFLE